MALSSSRLEPISYNEFDKFITQHNEALQNYLRSKENVKLEEGEQKQQEEQEQEEVDKCKSLDMSTLKLGIIAE